MAPTVDTRVMTAPETLGKSLIVPSVQELAKQSLAAVPARYLRTEQQPPVYKSDDPKLQLPVIDMGKLVDGDEAELQKFHSACQEWGFFQLVNHGVSLDLVEKVKKDILNWFNIPLEEKKNYWQTPGNFEGFGQSFVQSEEQKLDWADKFSLVSLPKDIRRPNLFPKLPLPFRDDLEDYSEGVKKLATQILDVAATALKLDKEYLKDLFDDGKQALRMNYYPPCPEADKVIGLSPHSDAVGLTILLQLNETEGLQIRKDGLWFPVKPLPGAFVVNVGDILEMITNGTYRSIEHRAMINPSKERLSVAAFHSPRLDADIGPAQSLITPGTPARFKRIIMADFFKGLFSRPLDGKSYLDLMRV
ncbi:Oxoglutarate-dependent flavonoid 7-O-demethylase 1-like protein [Drosera capensis]